MKIIIVSPDMDTCLGARILGVTRDDEVVVMEKGAQKEDLADPGVITIEAGGSGDVGNMNFDHHEPGKILPPACVQAYRSRPGTDPGLERLVDYVARMDDEPGKIPPIAFPQLSAVFSGMRFVVKDKKEQFFTGIGIFDKVLENRIDPFSPMPFIPEWQPYIRAKIQNRADMEDALQNSRIIHTKGGLKAGFLTSRSIGGIKFLYEEKGCDLAVLHNPEFGEKKIVKYTISASPDTKVNLGALLPVLNEKDPGWGGRETILGSPREKDSMLSPETLLSLIRENL